MSKHIEQIYRDGYKRQLAMKELGYNLPHNLGIAMFAFYALGHYGVGTFFLAILLLRAFYMHKHLKQYMKDND